MFARNPNNAYRNFDFEDEMGMPLDRHNRPAEVKLEQALAFYCSSKVDSLFDEGNSIEAQVLAMEQ